MAAAEQPGAPKVAVCFQNRYNATSQAMAALLASGRLGSVLGGSATVCWHRPPAYYQSRPWRGQVDRSGGGVLINQAIHSIDLLQWLLGDVRAVWGQANRLALGGVFDIENKRAASCWTTRAALGRSFSPPTPTPPIHQSPSRSSRRGPSCSSVATSPCGTPTGAPRRSRNVGPPPPAAAYWGVSHQQLIGDFYARLAEPEPFWISPREAAKSLDILSRVYASSSSSSELSEHG